MAQEIGVTSDDIAEVAQSLGCCFDDPGRRQALLCDTSRDVQACPGSGKTTLLVAKLAVLAKRWPWRDRGICVLSHTNVARQEVETRLHNHPSACDLLSYPHFIGTIQVFVDQFLALPHLRDQGIEVSAVDDERFEMRIWQLLPLYHYAWTYVSKRSMTGSAMVAGLRFEGAALRIGSAGGKLPGSGTRSYQELQALKNRVAGEGIFRFDDMYAFAEAYLAKNPFVAEALRLRFPWVFIDEMQDTEAKQDDLLTRIFSDPCIVQRFGDINQAIFRDGRGIDAQTSFPLEGCIDLPESKRFGQAIATFASPLTAESPQELVGLPDTPDHSHTIFLFDEDSVAKVLAAFGDLLAEEYSDGLPPYFTAKAVGFRKKEAQQGSQSKVPYAIGDYWRHFQAGAVSKSARPSHLVDCVRRARHILEQQGECKQAYDCLIEGLLGFLHRQGGKDAAGSRFTKTRLMDAVKEADDTLSQLQALLWDWCFPERSLDEQYWKDASQTLVGLLKPWCGGLLTQEAAEFLGWTERLEQSWEGGAELPDNLLNVYRHKSPVGSIDIELATIHAVKGETHAATLVLETYWYDHDLKDLLPFFIDSSNPRPGSTTRSYQRMKRVFVAMTRPKELLCLAMHKGHVDGAQAEMLVSRGWIVNDLTLK